MPLKELFWSHPTNFKRTAGNLKLWERQGPIEVDRLIKEKKFEFDNESPIKQQGEYYCGQVDKNGIKKGLGRFDCQSYLYEGMWNENKWNGYGRLIFTDGDVFLGTFLNNTFHGFGKKILGRDGRVEQGYFDQTQFMGENYRPPVPEIP